MDKTERLLRMMEHPEQYSDAQWQELLSDEECRELYEAMRLSASAFEAKDAKEKIANGIKEEEWQKFESVELRTESLEFPTGLQTSTQSRAVANSKLYTLNSKLLKLAAAFIGLLMLSGITYATIHIASNIESKPKVAITDRKPDVKKVKKTYGLEAAPTKKAPVIYNNVELQQIMQYIADGYCVKVEFKNEAARTLRFYLQWEADDTLQEIIDKINHFEKVHLTLTDETITIE